MNRSRKDALRHEAGGIAVKRRAGRRPRRGRSPARLIIATSDIDADLLYATRFFAPDPFIYFEIGGRRSVVLSPLEIDRGRREARVDSVLPLAEIQERMRKAGVRGGGLGEVAAWLLASRGVRRVRVPGSFPIQYVAPLRRRGVRVEVGGTPFYPQRLRKRGEEIRHLREAMRIAEAGMAAGIECLRASRAGRDGVLKWRGATLTSERLRTVIDQAVLARGGVPAGTIVAGGIQGCDPHEQGHGPLRADESIILDIFPRAARTGYFGDITRTVVRGRASEALRRQWNTVKSAQALALRTLRAGIDGASVHGAIVELFEKRGYRTAFNGRRMQGFFHGTGHGLGLEIHEPLRVNALPRRLEAGNVVTVEPGLYYPRTGGVRIEDAVVIGRRGNRNLTRFPKYLEI